VIVAATLLEDPGLFTIPLTAGGTAEETCTSGVTADLIYEPFTRVILRKTQSTLEAYSVIGTPTAPHLSVKALPQLPTVIDWTRAEVRRTPTVDCD
jgi:hypothetical protein